MNGIENLFQLVKKSGKKSFNKKHIYPEQHGSVQADITYTCFELKIGRHIIKASIEHDKGGSLAGFVEVISRKLVIKTNRNEVFSAIHTHDVEEERQAKTELERLEAKPRIWTVEKGKIPKLLLIK